MHPGDNNCYTKSCIYAACRDLLGIVMQGDFGIQHLINIHFFSPRLGQLAASKPAMLYFVFNAQVIAVLVAHTIREGEFVAQVGTYFFSCAGSCLARSFLVAPLLCALCK